VKSARATSPAVEAASPDLVKIKLTIAYDGANYHGWQAQKTEDTVQQRVEKVLCRFFPSVDRIHGSSRTDKGVHAYGMVAHAEFPRAEFRITIRQLLLALNAFLPEDIRIVRVQRVPNSFHARFDSVGKQYRYQLWNHRAFNPIMRGLTWHVPVKLDLEQMKQASKHFLGKQDFRSLATKQDYKISNTTRTVYRCDVRASGPLVTFVIEGDGFLYKMCRSIVGTLCLVGQGKQEADAIPKLLAQKARQYAGMSAPAQGLTLYKVYYSPPANWPRQVET
jgi:tRNA pseudouridine38-40 synthase